MTAPDPSEREGAMSERENCCKPSGIKVVICHCRLHWHPHRRTNECDKDDYRRQRYPWQAVAPAVLGVREGESDE